VVDGVGLLYRDAWQCAAKTVAAEGPQALYKGCTAHFMRVGPHTVLTLLLLDRAQRALGLHPPQQQQDQPAAKAARPAK
jgi:DNA-binding transcriptional regulator YbjK